MNGELPSSGGASRRARVRATVTLLATLAGVAIAARLGVWQLDRADQKIALQTMLEARSREPALDGAA
ncbi:MAG: SURF1 family protein, partial [Pseudomonadota bacterium]|nr:SURF1 family protein [Pseudomonadota bacterium]